MSKDYEIKEVSQFYASEISCMCPYCNERLYGWFGDPTGETTECDYCGKEFKISNEIDILY